MVAFATVTLALLENRKVGTWANYVHGHTAGFRKMQYYMDNDAKQKGLQYTLKKQHVATAHRCASGVWETDCDRCCLAQVSPSLLSVPRHLLRQIGYETV